MVFLQTDDTEYGGNAAIIKLEGLAKMMFDSRKFELLKSGWSIKFKGGDIKLERNYYSLTEPNHVMKLSKLDEKYFSKAEFVAELARVSYVSAVFRPDSSFVFCVTYQITQPDAKDVMKLNKVIDFCRSNTNRGLKFVPLYLQSLSMAVFVDAGLETIKDM